MSPKGKWEILRKFINMWLYCIGLPVLDRKFKIYWLSYLPLIIIGVDTVILIIHTMRKLIFDPLKAIEPTILA